MDKSLTEALIAKAAAAAIEAGRAILKVYVTGFDVVCKDDGSPLTRADLESSRTIKQLLETTGLPFVSEEDCCHTYKERAAFSTYWLVDPLDGTKEFIKRNDEFTVNIALMECQRPVAGVVYAPVTDTMWVGHGEEAYRIERASRRPISSMAGLQPIGKADKTSRPYTILVSRSHRNNLVDRYVETNILPFHRDAVVTPLGSTLKFAMLAEGKADIYVCYSDTKEWDTAAAQALLEATGGHIRRISDGMALDYGKETFANPPFIAVSH